MKLVYLIRDRGDRDCYWSNEHGWTDRENATEFTELEASTFALPIGGEWMPVMYGVLS